jgi:hypothetical protein
MAPAWVAQRWPPQRCLMALPMPSIVLADMPVSDPGFWQCARDSGTTHLAGVPYSHEMLERVGLHDIARLGTAGLNRPPVAPRAGAACQFFL